MPGYNNEMMGLMSGGGNSFAMTPDEEKGMKQKQLYQSMMQAGLMMIARSRDKEISGVKNVATGLMGGLQSYTSGVKEGKGEHYKKKLMGMKGEEFEMGKKEHGLMVKGKTMEIEAQENKMSDVRAVTPFVSEFVRAKTDEDKRKALKKIEDYEFKSDMGADLLAELGGQLDDGKKESTIGKFWNDMNPDKPMPKQGTKEFKELVSSFKSATKTTTGKTANVKFKSGEGEAVARLLPEMGIVDTEGIYVENAITGEQELAETYRNKLPEEATLILDTVLSMVDREIDAGEPYHIAVQKVLMQPAIAQAIKDFKAKNSIKEDKGGGSNYKGKYKLPHTVPSYGGGA